MKAKAHTSRSTPIERKKRFARAMSLAWAIAAVRSRKAKVRLCHQWRDAVTAYLEVAA